MVQRVLLINKAVMWGQDLRGEPQIEPQEVSGMGVHLTLLWAPDVSFNSDNRGALDPRLS